MRIRYIRDWANGNTNGSNSNWNEIGAYDYNNINIALNKTVTPSKDGSSSVSASVVTDGSDDAAFAFSGLGNVTIDLGGIYDIDRIRIRRYFPNGNSTTQYHETKTEVSIDGQDWITVFDCAIEGKYYETSEGKIIKLRKEIDKLEENSSLKDIKDKIIEIENSLQTTKDDFKNTLINKGVECSNIDKISSLINNIKFASANVRVSNEYIMNLTRLTRELVEYPTNTVIIDKITLPFNGSLRFCFSIQCRATFHDATAKIDLYSKDGLLKSTKLFTTTSTTNAYASKINCEYDILNIKESDYITVTALSTHNTYGIHFNELSFKGEVV